MHRQSSRMYAPYGTCRKCGWSGQDWAFKYQGLCGKCYKRWRRERAEERKRTRPPNRNVEVAKGLVVTENVRKRLLKRAHCDVPPARRERLAEWCGCAGSFLWLMSMVVLMFTWGRHPRYVPFLVACAALGFVMSLVGGHIEKAEISKRMPIVQSRLEQLARERQKEIEEAEAFYRSAEWQLIRKQVIEEQGAVCQECGVGITDEFDLTVDHVNPRSRFPDGALDVSNLRVLCRRCNSRKGSRVL